LILDKEKKEQIKQEARERLSGFYARGIAKDYVVKVLLQEWSNELLQAVIDRSANQVSRYRTGRTKLGDLERDAIYNFYLELSDSPLPQSASGMNYQSYPIYTQKEARDAYNELTKSLKKINYIVNVEMKSQVKDFRELRNEAPNETVIAKRRQLYGEMPNQH